ncbi:hypothetical protein DS832_02220 [Bombilactobacillus bombi]|uniref:ABC transporter permease n=1 Tax=Bombilactobacillus bombi TaxID=1303590 RepID=A0A3R6VHL7_9LACO|nr:ABC transporter permease [Bombilactobacillus bombi]RHW48396.1 hypothetical protein DS832_02220 [Bombilactobacillus bombi]
MKSLWQQRFIAHIREQSKFLKLVFNEYFIIAIIFMIGAVGFWYSQALDTLPANSWWTKPVAIIIMGIVTLLFQPVTLLQSADTTFLLPQEKSLPRYLAAARNYSLLLPCASLLLTGFFLTPFLARGASFTISQVILLTLTSVLLAVAVITNQLSSLYNHHTLNYLRGENIVGVLIVLAISTYLNSWLALILAIIWLAVSEYRWHLWFKTRVFNWSLAITKEKGRSYQLKRFYNLFTDVPGIASKIARRQWLDWLFKPIALQQQNTYLYLFMRGFIRNTEYSGLFLRLTIVALLLIYAIHNYLLITIIVALFLYLVEFQLLPLYKNYDAIVLTQIYPLTPMQKQQSFKKLLVGVLSLQWLLMAIVLVICHGMAIEVLVPLFVSLLMVGFLVELYLPRQLKKLNKN